MSIYVRQKRTLLKKTIITHIRTIQKLQRGDWRTQNRLELKVGFLYISQLCLCCILTVVKHAENQVQPAKVTFLFRRDIYLKIHLTNLYHHRSVCYLGLQNTITMSAPGSPQASVIAPLIIFGGKPSQVRMQNGHGVHKSPYRFLNPEVLNLPQITEESGSAHLVGVAFLQE